MNGRINIFYDIKGDYALDSNMSYEGISEILDSYIRMQFGRGDNSKANEKECYTFELEWNPDFDKILFRSDTGNKGLDLGILLDVFTDF